MTTEFSNPYFYNRLEIRVRQVSSRGLLNGPHQLDETTPGKGKTIIRSPERRSSICTIPVE